MPRRKEREPDPDEWPNFDRDEAAEDPGDYDQNDPWLELGDPGEWNL
jgi:hypothetical protein